MDKQLIIFYILCLCTRDAQFLIKTGEYLYTNDVKGLTKRTYFDSKREQIVFDLLYYIFSKTGKLASYKDCEFIITNLYKAGELRDNLLNDVYNLFNFNDDFNFDLVREESKKFIKERRFIEALSESQKDLEAKNYEVVTERLEKSLTINFDSDYGVNIKDFASVQKAFEDNTDNTVVYPTGYDMLDSEKILNGGCRPHELYVVAASSGVGKTMWMAGLGVNFALAGKKVLYISFETSAYRLTSRIMANLLNDTTTSIAYNFSENPETMKEAWEQNVATIPGELRVKEFPSGTMNCNQIEAFILDLEKNTGFRPDVLFLDYIGIMRPNDSKISKESSYIYSGAVVVEQRALAYKLNCCVWTGTQLNRGALSGKYNKEDLGSDSLSESMVIEHTADFLMFLTHNQSDARQNQLQAYVVKNRNGEKGLMKLQINDNCRLTEIKEKN